MEKWKRINDFYKISDFGNVKSLEKVMKIGRNSYLKKELILKQKTTNSGYKTVSLGKGKYRTIHRLVAIAFIPNINNKCCVNHKDGNKLNNQVTNLEWVSYSENHLHAYKIGLKIANNGRKGKFGKDNPVSKKITQFGLNGIKIAEYYGVYEIKRITGFSPGNINQVCLGKRKTANGYIWKYE